MSAPVYPRCNGDTCIKCRRKFQRGERVLIVNIIEKTGKNPSNPLQVGSWLSGEFEIMHANCEDTALGSTIIISGPAT